jgi:hypothetical protein
MAAAGGGLSLKGGWPRFAHAANGMELEEDDAQALFLLISEKK